MVGKLSETKKRIGQKTVSRKIELLGNLEEFPKSLKHHALFQDKDFWTPLYNV